MSKQATLQENVQYVRDVAERAAVDPGPPGVHLLWAAIVLAGGLIADFTALPVGAYWAIAGPAGGGLTYLVRARDARRRGHRNRAREERYTLHWIALLGAILLALVPVATGALSPAHVAPLLVLLATLTSFLAGVHLFRGFYWIAAFMAAGYVLALFVDRHPWTINGGVIAGGLLMVAYLSARLRGAST